MWAEDETGGEAYIPLHPSKRRRSEQILADTARRFGGTYVSGDAASYAQCAVVGETASAGHLLPNITQKIVFVNPTVRDPEKDAAKAGRVLGGMVMGGMP
ncbi:hypothetical protein [Microbacterium oleivorans]|uniref:hypothetical protein n=1 Tax=Microbacterium oleivorans TaxID=273677 RepID=UPI00080DE2A5|nr:hypothetical protein [Microbacterium oleivorans]